MTGCFEVVDGDVITFWVWKVTFLTFFFREVANPNIDKNISVLVEADGFKLEAFFVLKVIVLGTDCLSIILVVVHSDCCCSILYPQLVDLDCNCHTIGINIRDRPWRKRTLLALWLLDDVIFCNTVLVKTIRWSGTFGGEGSWRHSRA